MNATKLNIEQIKAKLQALRFDGIEWNAKTKTYDDVLVGPTVFMEGNVIRVSGEDGLGIIDYYGEQNHGYQYIHPRLEAFATTVGGFWEWRDASCIGLYF